MPDIPQIIDYVTLENAMILLMLGDFWSLDDFWAEVWREERVLEGEGRRRVQKMG